MYNHENQEVIRVLIADDDELVLDCYRNAFNENESSRHEETIVELEAELFDPAADTVAQPKFEVVACTQGDDAISLAEEAANDGSPFDVVILDVRMPPGIDGVETGSRIRAMDPEIEIVFVSGFSDVPIEELQRRVPPMIKLHYFNKPLSFSKLAHDVVSMLKTH